MPAILMIDDDTGLCELVEQYLALDGYQFSAAHDGPHGLTLAETGNFQLILLDIMLPGMDGLSVLKTLRANAHYCPVLMLTARGDDVDRIVGLELGADDYLAKPCLPRELSARIRAILRRVQQHQQHTELHCGALTIRSASRSVYLAQQQIELTGAEFSLLYLLAAAAHADLRPPKAKRILREVGAAVAGGVVRAQGHDHSGADAVAKADGQRGEQQGGEAGGEWHGEQRRAHEQGLLQDEQRHGGHHKAAIAFDGVEQRHHLRVDGLHAHAHGPRCLAALVACGHLDAR